MLLNGPDATSSGAQEHPGKCTFADVNCVCTSVDREGVSVKRNLSFAFAAIEPIAGGAAGLYSPVSGAGHYDSVILRVRKEENS